MLCQFCKKNAATIKISNVLNYKKIEINLCSKCAEEKGVNNPMGALPHVFENFIAELVGKEFFRRTERPVEKKCKACGLSWESFEETGLLGCDICYQTFQDHLDIVLCRIHGSNHHIGSRPKSKRQRISEAELGRIKGELDDAIKSEDFERAAELRDIVRDAQRELDRENDGMIR